MAGDIAAVASSIDLMGAARMLAVGLAVMPLMAVAFAVSKIFCTLLDNVGRNPAARDKLFTIGIIGFAVTEAIALFALLIALMLLTTK